MIVQLGSASVSALADGSSSDTVSRPDASLPSSGRADEGLTEIVVTAQRRSTSLEHTPVSVEVLSGESLAKQGIASDADLQFAAPGLTVKSTQGGSTINYALRGQTVDYSTESAAAVLPYFNEVPLLGSSVNAFYDLQSIQVIKGPQGTLFGRNVTGGAVLLSSVKPTESLTGYADVRYGSYHDVEFEGAVGGAVVPDVLQVRVAAYDKHRDGYQLNLFNDSELGGIDRQAGRFSATFTPSENITDELVFDYLRDGGTNYGTPIYSVTAPSHNQRGNPIVPLNLLYPLVAAQAAQAARGPYTVDLDAPTSNDATNSIVSNITSLKIGPGLTLRNILGYQYHRSNINADQDGTQFFLLGYGNNTTPTSGDLYIDRQISDEVQILGEQLKGRLEDVAGFYFSNSQQHRISHLYALPDLGGVPTIDGGIVNQRSFAGYAQATLRGGSANLDRFRGLDKWNSAGYAAAASGCDSKYTVSGVAPSSAV